ncbi:MAG: cytidylate kinase-like family protein [Clostridiales bacterium]|nr:cytidylate kinase-like family protein [Clostridiales bacterium]
MQNQLIITIGREYGSGGRELGELLAKRLGIAYYDKEILARAAQESGICEEVMEAHDEKGALRSLLGASASLGGAMSGVGYGMQMPMNQRIFQAQFDAITQLAAEGPCVFVGRCADYVLRGRPNVTHVFVYASEEHKTERIMRVMGVDADKARELIKKTDKQRKSYYNFYADGNWGMRSNYDLMLRTDGHSLEELVELVAAYAHIKMETAQQG